MKYLVILIMIMIGCIAEPLERVDYSVDYDNARQATIEAWEEIIGPVSMDCRAESRATVVVEIDSDDEYPQACREIALEPTKIRTGCYVYGPNQIYILSSRSERQRADTAVHEWTHMLSMCEAHDGDTGHDNVLLWIIYGIGTVEAVGCANL